MVPDLIQPTWTGCTYMLICLCMCVVYLGRYVYACACMSVSVPCVCGYPQRPGHWILWNWSYRLLGAAWHGCLELNIGSSQEQQVLITAEPAFEPLGKLAEPTCCDHHVLEGSKLFPWSSRGRQLCRNGTLTDLQRIVP